jgi:methylenetetrahydrofolate reductase (NADPH)
MNLDPARAATRRLALARLLDGYSIEVVASDHGSVAVAANLLRRGCETFIAHPPHHGDAALVSAAARLRGAGLVPVPHIVARNIDTRSELDRLLGRLSGAAGVTRAIVLGGDRDRPAGEFADALSLIETGLFERNGFSSLSLACYPEAHPRVGAAALDDALAAKLAALEARGLNGPLISQFAFEPQPVIALARRLRDRGIAAPLRVGVAGPATRRTLVAYALRCGVGASLRALRARQDLARNVLAGETPGDLLRAVAEAAASEPALGIAGVHFFTFGAPAQTVGWADQTIRDTQGGDT